jgi:hypothetical protein
VALLQLMLMQLQFGLGRQVVQLLLLVHSCFLYISNAFSGGKCPVLLQ